MKIQVDEKIRAGLFEYLLRLGDDRIILGHRLSELCGHAPILEEDIALTNIALDCVGQASAFLTLAGEVEANGKTEDDLIYFREAVEFKNVQLVEQPNIDFAYTIVRQFFCDVFSYFLYDELQSSRFKHLAAITEKSLKEVSYHLRHSKQWILRLGNGTEESNIKAQTAVDDLWRFTNELFIEDNTDKILNDNGIVPRLDTIKLKWEEFVKKILSEATLSVPEESPFLIDCRRQGKHSEYLGHIIAEMQIVARSFAEA